MVNENNLKPVRSKEEARERGHNGGIASGKSRRQMKSMTELARKIAAAPASKSNKKVLKDIGLTAADASNNAVVTASVFRAAIKGSMAAVDKWQQLTETVDDSSRVYLLPAKEIGKAFVDINRNITPNREYVFKGGRGSLKSSYVGFKIVELIKNRPLMHACAVRKVSNTLKDSVFAQIKWCITELGLEEEFTFKTSPVEIIYKKTGQTIYFRGADDPVKLKSIKPPFGYIGILWLEEVDQFCGIGDLRSIEQSILRGGDESYLFESFNPPKSKSNFMNKHVQERKPNMVVHESNYRDSPPEWLGTFFLSEAEHLREINPDAYENEYMGVANGAGGLVFDNLEDREITDEEITHFDRIYQGVDWGWYPDQYAFVRLYYDADRETIYIFAEHYVNKQSNEQTAQWIIDTGYDDYPMTCDSAEPKSVADYVGMGLMARGAVKGPGSIEYSFKWLQRRHIVIDSARCPNTWREFSEYQYEKDKDGNDISGYPDGNDHAISAVRYALESCMNRRGNKA